MTLAALHTATAPVCLDAVACDDAGRPNLPFEAHPTYLVGLIASYVYAAVAGSHAPGQMIGAGCWR
jgi:hypothetical protein